MNISELPLLKEFAVAICPSVYALTLHSVTSQLDMNNLSDKELDEFNILVNKKSAEQTFKIASEMVKVYREYDKDARAYIPKVTEDREK